MSQSLSILYLYPEEMNIYGDIGNVRTLTRRLEWRGIKTELLYHHPGEPFSYQPDIIVGGGGQDSGQLKVCEDLQHIGNRLKELADAGTPMLMVCGMYQLFGNRFITNEGHELPGIGIFDAETRGGNQRLIGTLVIDTPFGEIVGYENHSGQTHLSEKQRPFGIVKRGYGNTAENKAEGAVTNNAYGTYLHGSVLPKNPKFADELIQVAMTKKYGHAELTPLNDTLADKAREIAAKR